MTNLPTIKSGRRMLTLTGLAMLVCSIPVIAMMSGAGNIQTAEATTYAISNTYSAPNITVNAGDTLLVEQSAVATITGLTNYGTILIRGSLTVNTLDNYGVVIVAQSSTQNLVVNRVLTNLASGLMIFDSGSKASGNEFTNYGTVNVHSQTFGPWPIFNNRGSASVLNNYGSIQVSVTYPDAVPQGNQGTINNYGSISFKRIYPADGSAPAFYNAGTFNNNFANSAIFLADGATFTNSATGKFVNTRSYGINISAGTTYDNFGSTTNTAFAGINNQGTFKRECNDVFSNSGTILGNPVVNSCAAFTPVTHMSDTTQSYGVAVGSLASQIVAAELVKPTSQLVGDKIDSITVRLQRLNTPTGTAVIGVFDANMNVKKYFGFESGAGSGPTYQHTLPTTMTTREYKLALDDPGYVIQSGDRIGIWFLGGSGNGGTISVMMDKVTTDTIFDGQNTQRVRGFADGTWSTLDVNEDLYMVLKQTKP